MGPVLDVGFVKLRSTIEYAIYGHIPDVARLPGPYVLIKHRSIFEHAPHIRDVAPAPGPDALVKVRSALEHARHIRDVACSRPRCCGQSSKHTGTCAPYPRRCLSSTL